MRQQAPESNQPKSARRWSLIVAGVFAGLVAAAAATIKGDLPLEELRARYAPAPSKFIELGGMSVHYRDEGSGPPLVLLHGTGASLHTWEGWVSALRRDFRMVRMDLPGFGLTGPNPSGDYTSAAYVEFLESFAARLGLDRFDLGGNSLGGFLAWRYAFEHPERVRKLILVDAAGYPQSRPPVLVFRLARIPVLSSLLAHVDPRRFAEKTLRQAYADPARATPQLVQQYADLALRPGNRQAFVARVSAPERDRSAQIRGLRLPTLVLWGRQDELLAVDNADRFGRDIPGSRVIIYDGVGHVPMEEIAERSAADARAFLLQSESVRR